MKTLTPKLHKALASIAHFGFLTTRELAQLNWSALAPASAIVMSQNACKRLLEEGLVIKKALPVDKLQAVYVLGSRGAKLLNEVYFEQWLEANTVDGAQWFADGYNLSLSSHVARRPLINLLYDVLLATAGQGHDGRAAATLMAVGQRSISRGYLGLQRYRQFDAMLLDLYGKPKFGVYLAHSSLVQSSISVCELAKAPEEFLIAAPNISMQSALIRWRAKVNPGMADLIAHSLPPGVIA